MEINIEDYKMSAKTFYEKKKGQPKPVILDLRPSEIATLSKIEGTHNLPFSELEDRLMQLPPFGTLILFSDDQNSNIEAAINLLWENGFSDLFYIDGGYTAILKELFSISKETIEKFRDIKNTLPENCLGYKILIARQDYKIEPVFSKEETQTLSNISFGELLIWVDPSKARLLEDSILNIENDILTIDHPRMHEPKLEGSMHDIIQKLLDEQINPSIAMHGGFAKLIKVEGDSVYIELGGGCQGCASASATVKQGIETIIKDTLPEISNVIDVTEHSEGLNPYF